MRKRRSQQDKVKAAKRPRKEYFFWYMTEDSPRGIKVRHYSEEDQRNWEIYCRTLEGLPGKLNYEIFKKKHNIK